MEITIFYDEHCISTKITKGVRVSDLLKEVKEYFKENNAEFSIFDKNRKALSPKYMINPEKGTQEFFLFKKSSYPKKEENKEPIAIEKMIMNETKGKKTLQNIKYNINSYDPKEIIDFEGKEEKRENNNERFDIFRFIDNLSINRNGGNDDFNNSSINMNESNIITLREMGFSEEQARNALIQARNNLDRATEILIQGNEVQDDPEEN